jgi:hypothetical protein
LCAEHVEKKGIQDGMQMRASIEERNPVLQERAMTSREGAIGRDEINATGKSGVEWAVVFFGEADSDGSQRNVCRET